MIYFTDNMEFKRIKIDVQRKTFGFTFRTPVVNIPADYEITWNLLLPPIYADGMSNITLINLTLEYEATFSLEDGADGQKYIKFNSGTYKTKALYKAYFHMFYRYNSDYAVGETTFDFLLGKAREVYDELGQVFLEGMAEETRNILNHIVDGVSLNDLFLQ